MSHSRSLARPAVAYGALILLGATSMLLSQLWVSWPSDDRTLVPSSPIVHVTDPRGHNSQIAEFVLRNVSDSDVIIESVESGCNCVQATNLEGAVIGPGKSMTAKFSVDIPIYGTKTTNIWIRLKDEGIPTLLQVVAEGVSQLPVVQEVENGSPAFLDLESVDEFADITIITREREKDSPWITGLSGSMDEAKFSLLEQLDVKKPNMDFIERKYLYRMTWDKLPNSLEFACDIVAVADGDQIRLGRARGSLKR